MPLGRWRWPAVAFCAGVVGLALVVGLGLLLYTTGPTLLDAGVFGAVPFSVSCLGVVVGAALVIAMIVATGLSA